MIPGKRSEAGHSCSTIQHIFANTMQSTGLAVILLAVSVHLVSIADARSSSSSGSSSSSSSGRSSGSSGSSGSRTTPVTPATPTRPSPVTPTTPTRPSPVPPVTTTPTSRTTPSVPSKRYTPKRRGGSIIPGEEDELDIAPTAFGDAPAPRRFGPASGPRPGHINNITVTFFPIGTCPVANSSALRQFERHTVACCECFSTKLSSLYGWYYDVDAPADAVSAYISSTCLGSLSLSYLVDEIDEDHKCAEDPPEDVQIYTSITVDVSESISSLTSRSASSPQDPLGLYRSFRYTGCGTCK